MTAVSQRTTFVPTSENWKICEQGEGSPVRVLGLASKTPDSCVQTVRILGYGNGDIELEVSFLPTSEKTAQIFKERELTGFVCTAKSTTARAKLFTILKENCEFSVKGYPLISTLIGAEKWQNVTPLPRGEKLALPYPEEEICTPIIGYLAEELGAD